MGEVLKSAIRSRILRHKGRSVWFLLLTVVFVTSLALPEDTASSGPTLCMVKQLTGFDCPGCGMSRAFVHLWHGDITTAITFHPLVLVVVPVLLVLWICLAIELLAGREILSNLPSRAVNRASICLAAAFVLVWLVRTAAGLGTDGIATVQQSDRKSVV